MCCRNSRQKLGRNLDEGRRIYFSNSSDNHRYRGNWLVIDEFNRADIDKAFGQLFTSLRTRSLKLPTNEIGKSYKDMKIPKDYRIIGTLNTADKHFLFQLSDALKSRFSYIQIDIPERTEYETEIYYAITNAIDRLHITNYDDILSINRNQKKVTSGKTNPQFYNIILQAYKFLESVRVFKKLGTGILQLLFQNILVTIRITGNNEESLDNALTSILIPQMENLSLATLGALEAIYKGTVIQYFEEAYKSPNRQSYTDVFEKILEYFMVPDYEKLSERFASGTLNIENTNVWKTTEDAMREHGQDFSPNLNQFTSSIADLKKSAVV